MENKVNIPNLIYLQDDGKLDEIDYLEDYTFDEISPFKQYCLKISEEICNEMKISIPEAKFAVYNWSGFPDKLPWNYKNKIPFDPAQVSVIVPETGTYFKVIGENRKIILTSSPTYEGKKPFYFVGCTSERELESIRILDLVPGKMFWGLEKAITEEGFNQLPKLKDKSNCGLIHVDYVDIIVPSSLKKYI